MRAILLLTAASPARSFGFPLLSSGANRRAAASSGCPDHAPPGDLPATLPANLTAALAAVDALARAAVNAVSVPGVSLTIDVGGRELLHTSFGVSSKSPPTPVTRDTLFRIASVSKVFPALIWYALDEAAYYPLDGLVAPLLPLNPSPPSPQGSNDITVRQLLSHTSGLQREAPPGNETAAVLAAVGPLIVPPGTRPSYSNLGFAVAGYAAAVVSPNPAATLPSLVSDIITTPLNLASTGYAYTPSVLSRLAGGYDANGDAVPFADLGWWYAAGSMYSTTTDLVALGRGILNAPASGLDIQPRTARDFLKPVFMNPDGASGMGTPWEILVIAGFVVRLKGGNLPGYTAAVAIVPDLDLTLAVTFNGGVDEFGFVSTALSALLPALNGAFAAVAGAYSPGPRPADYVGTYTLSGTEVIVRQIGGQLLWDASRAIGVSVWLEWSGDGDVFRAAFADDAFTCLIGELQALRFQYVVFSRTAGVVDATSMPGWVPAAVWVK